MGWALTAEGTDWVGVPESVQWIIDGRDAYRPGVNGMMSRQRHDVTAVALDNPYTGLLKAELRNKFLKTRRMRRPASLFSEFLNCL